MDPEWFSPVPDPAFQVILDPDRQGILLYVYIIGSQQDFKGILKIFLGNVYVMKDVWITYLLN